jgi:hypothetical protein
MPQNIDLFGKVCLDDGMTLRTALDMHRRPCSRRRRSVGDGPTARLDDLAWRIAALWTVEPDVSPTMRSALHEALADLEASVDRMLVRHHSGEAVDAQQVVECGRRFHHLRRQWNGPASA